MVARTAWLRLFAGLALCAATVACGAVAAPSATQQVCDGVSSEMGGCAPDRHTFTASTCVDLAREWAEQLDEQTLAVIDGPAVVGDEARSVRLHNALIMLTSTSTRGSATWASGRTATSRVHGRGQACVLARASAEGAGRPLRRRPEVDVEDWLAEVERVVRTSTTTVAPAGWPAGDGRVVRPRGVAQPGSAPEWGSGGRAFESLRPDHSAEHEKAPGARRAFRFA